MPKVVNNGEGSALLKNPNLIEEIVRKVSSAISKPLTVKVRIGFENEPVDIVEIAKRIEDAGAAALAVHGAPDSSTIPALQTGIRSAG